MSEKYLGKEFDIHGGGMDLLFPHHECEIAQNTASRGCSGVKYWMHNNMITIEGKKMGKSLGNFITLPELFAGRHEKLEQAYTPMTVRFFILQAHYRGTLDFSNEALQAAEKGLKRIMQAAKDKKLTLDASDYTALVSLFDNIVYGVLGLRDEESEGGKAMQTIDGLVNMVLEQRKAAKAAKDWAASDRIRDDLKALGIQIKDTKDGTEWTLE